MSFAAARALADAVLLEGYVLYPYRASSTKNRFRWTFGVVAPREWSEAGGCEPWWFGAATLLEPRGEGRVQARLRFLQTERRTVEEALPGGGFRPVARLEHGGELHLPWDEGRVHEVDFEVEGDGVVPFEIAGQVEREELFDPDGAVRGRLVRERWPLRGLVRIRREAVGTMRPAVRLRFRVENLTPFADPAAPRDEALRGSLLAAHLLLRAPEGGFVSLTDPPGELRGEAAACENVRSWPVLVGPPGSSELVLCAPIVLYDHAQLAPESPGDFFDATEIDELLTLRTSTLTPGEKREARATDPRAAALLDRVDGLPPEGMERLHGTLRELRREEMVPRFVPPAPEEGGPPPTFAPGAKVRLRPGKHRTDAQDVLFAGRVATVEAVLRDVDGQEFVAVTLDDDPAKELHRWYGRLQHYRTDEVEPA